MYGAIMFSMDFHIHKVFELCFPVISRYSMKVVKAAAQVLNTLWQYRDLRTFYKKVCVLNQLSELRDTDVLLTS